jgi:hypothetical protein
MNDLERFRAIIVALMLLAGCGGSSTQSTDVSLTIQATGTSNTEPSVATTTLNPSTTSTPSTTPPKSKGVVANIKAAKAACKEWREFRAEYESSPESRTFESFERFSQIAGRLGTSVDALVQSDPDFLPVLELEAWYADLQKRQEQGNEVDDLFEGLVLLLDGYKIICDRLDGYLG